MSKLEFTIKDFEGMGFYDRKTAMEQANKRLAEMLKDAVVVYSCGPLFYWNKDDKMNHHSHKALLINIEEIKKECRHIPAFAFAMPNKCRECGVTLYIHWSDKQSGEAQKGVK